jgi:hypothetical protein
VSALEEHVCTVCRRSAVGYGYAPSGAAPVAWVCDDPECLRLVREEYTTLQRNFSRWESLAVQAGGKEAGAYLDAIGVTDLAKLTADQYREFCRNLVAGYRSGLKLAMRDEAPF